MRHKHLARQLHRALGVASEQALQQRLDEVRARGDAGLADGLAALLAAVDERYVLHEREMQVRTRMLEISSGELTGLNDQLRAEAARQRTVLQSLRASVRRLTFDAAADAPARAAPLLENAPVRVEDDLLGLTQALEQLVRQRETARALTEQILDQLPIPVFLKDRSGRFVRFNRHFQSFSGRSRAQMLGKRIEDFASPDWTAITHEEDALAWRSGRMVTSERRLKHIDPPIDVLINRVVITSGGESYLLGFSIDISEQRAARDAMQRAVESAQAASQAKSDFLANMSHEIRTPMNGILGMTALVLESPLAPEQHADLALVKASADALLTIVNDILDFSKIEAGKLDLEEVPFDVGQLAQETVRSMALRAQQKGLSLRCELPPTLARVMKGDPGRLRQVLLNLLGNAIKFTERGGVELALHAGPETGDRREIRFTVTDSGIGIAPAKQKLVFEPFSQVDGSTTREYGGTGLGLTICRRLVILMRGEIGVTSEPGVGSVFSFTVPLGQTGVQTPPTVLPAAWRAEPAPIDAVAAALPARAPAELDGAPGGLRILLAEDNPVNQRLALRLLEKLGHRISLVDNGLDAVEHAVRGAFDLVLMDVQMPGLDGLSATRRIRQWEAVHGGQLPIVAMTARAMQGDRERCIEAGMDDYLSKPIDSASLRALLAQFTPAADSAVLDWRAALQRLDGDDALLRELAALFIVDGPPMLAALAEALAASDGAATQRALHSIKGVLVNFGAQRAIDAADRLAAIVQPARARGAPAGTATQAGMLALADALDAVYAALREAIAA